MNMWHAQRNTGAASATVVGHWRPWLGFLLHLGEMVVAMMLGMMILGIPYGSIMGAFGYSHPVARFPELSALVMTLNMTLPMVAWMLYRRHGWEHAGEMAGAMFVPAIALVMLCIVGVIPHNTLSGAVMIVMLPAMVIVMLYRRSDYVHGDGKH
jgi:hypothetical protein